jgi:hypothetical protein
VCPTGSPMDYKTECFKTIKHRRILGSRFYREGFKTIKLIYKCFKLYMLTNAHPECFFILSMLMSKLLVEVKLKLNIIHQSIQL